ncbi:NAD(P)/FAD-dependent oxidoreductase [Edaphocola aurantiacus]|uniref:NAD(P)/FAD-dependent oxidoreductase n=1 Tax=Edaphocola aurantiacus TaxID=2601682 RepID=UPI001C943251|nr:tryptophan 7-halogenase [Edaphocola aurantiacus]
MNVINNKNKAEIVIIGGGVAGCTAAIALSGHYNVVLIDKLAAPVARVGECLPPAARRIFRRLGLPENWAQDGAGQVSSINSMGIQSYWGSDRVQIADHLRNPDGFGWHLDRQAFEVYLRKTALERGVQAIWPAKLHSAHYEQQRWHITTVDDMALNGREMHHIEARLVIDASGRSSHFARKAGVARQIQDKLISCWAVLPDKEDHKLSTISAAANGWWYSSALPGNKRVLAFQTDADLVDRAALRNTSGYLDLTQDNPQISALLERVDGAIDYRGTVAANSSCLEQFAGPQWVALGDAAMSFDPLSSQGMYNAMAGAMQLTELIQQTQVLTEHNLKNLDLFHTTYTNQMNAIWQQYLRHKDLFYRQERRWSGEAFWRRRGMF